MVGDVFYIVSDVFYMVGDVFCIVGYRRGSVHRTTLSTFHSYCKGSSFAGTHPTLIQHVKELSLLKFALLLLDTPQDSRAKPEKQKHLHGTLFFIRNFLPQCFRKEWPATPE